MVRRMMSSRNSHDTTSRRGRRVGQRHHRVKDLGVSELSGAEVDRAETRRRRDGRHQPHRAERDPPAEQRAPADAAARDCAHAEQRQHKVGDRHKPAPPLDRRRAAGRRANGLEVGADAHHPQREKDECADSDEAAEAAERRARRVAEWACRVWVGERVLCVLQRGAHEQRADNRRWPCTRPSARLRRLRIRWRTGLVAGAGVKGLGA